MESHSQGFIELLSAEQKPRAHVWYQGTADAVRQNREYLEECAADYFLILSGDQLYQIDFEALAAHAEKTGADLTIASVLVSSDDAKNMGILKVDNAGNIIDFFEKPQTYSSQDPFKSLSHSRGSDPLFFGSMGIYLFKRKALFDLLDEDLREDFGKHLIPTLIKKGNSAAFIYSGYWKDIGTVASFYHANIDLTKEHPPLHLASKKFPLYTVTSGLPPPKIHRTMITSSLICEGADVRAEAISHSVIGPRAKIGKGTMIDSSYIFGDESFRPEDHRMSIGENSTIKQALIDENVRIGSGVSLINRNKLKTFDSDNIYIRDGIIIVNRGAIIPDHFIL